MAERAKISCPSLEKEEERNFRSTVLLSRVYTLLQRILEGSYDGGYTAVNGTQDHHEENFEEDNCYT